MIAMLVTGLAAVFGFALSQAAIPAVIGELFDYDQVLSDILRPLIFVANVAGGIIVGVAVLRGLLIYVWEFVRDRGGEIPKVAIRLSLGRSLSLALEFQVAADILGTALDPTREDLIILAAVVALRTILNYFLGRELDEAQRREQQAGSTGATGTLTPVAGNPGDSA